MSRIGARFEALGEERRAALVTFITAGDPDPAMTVDLMHALVAAGADLIELGVPFSDPMADGPVIQRASERALRHHVSLRQVMEMVRQFRERDDVTPVILMGYLNPIEVLGYERFAEEAAAAGVDGAITVDMPPEEAQSFTPALKAHGIDPIFLVAPTSTDQRIDAISRQASGFLYYVSFKGVTGAASLDVASVERALQRIRSHTGLPIGVGFGIKDAESAAAIGSVADAVIVGSALVRLVEAHGEDREALFAALTDLVSAMRKALPQRLAEAG
ncbi:MAG: tryptophan synthase subunit alpha [Gammaproteobacteria bacterium]